MASEPTRDVDILYAAPPAEFTRRRNELAARLRKAGRREEAAAVRRLKRPSVPVWAINTLAREHADAVRAFVDATDRLRRAQLRDPTAVADATQAQRRALHALMRSAQDIVRRGGFGPTAQIVERMSRTLLGAAADRDARGDLLHGRLTEERQAPGFEALAGVRIAPPPERRTERREAPHEAPRRAARTRAAEERRAETARAAQARAEELARKARALDQEAAAREREAAEATRAVAELRAQVRQAEARARESQRAARKARAAAKRARRGAARLAAKRPRD